MKKLHTIQLILIAVAALVLVFDFFFAKLFFNKPMPTGPSSNIEVRKQES